MPPSFDKDKRNIVIFNSALEEFEGFPEWKAVLYDKEQDILKQIFTYFQKNEDFFFYFRIHPNLQNLNNTQMRELKELSNLNFKNVKIIWPHEKIDSYALLDACEKVVTFGSTLGVEACFWGKPSILIGRAYYEDLDCCYIPKSTDETIQLLKKDLSPKSNQGALAYGYWFDKFAISFDRFSPSYMNSDCNYWKDQIVPNLKLKDKIAIRFWWRMNNLKKYFAGKSK